MQLTSRCARCERPHGHCECLLSTRLEYEAVYVSERDIFNAQVVSYEPDADRPGWYVLNKATIALGPPNAIFRSGDFAHLGDRGTGREATQFAAFLASDAIFEGVIPKPFLRVG